ncbi:MAG: hypothetical protein WCG75_02205 [Armatimonadota bacterium]
MTQAPPNKLNWAWIPFVLLVLGFLEFVFVYLLQDKEALTSSIYTYYQSDYYTHLSAGEIPWIHFRFEYPPLAAYVLLFPAFMAGLSVLWVSILRATSCLVLSALTLRFLNKCDRIPENIRTLAGASVGIMSCVVPGFYFGLFDWTLVLANILMCLMLFGVSDPVKGAQKIWPLIFAGASVKLMPLLAAPFLLQVKQLRQKSNFWISMAVTALIHLPFVAFGFHNFRVFVAYHRARSIDCFSTYACVLNALQRLGKVTIERKWSYGAYEVEGSYGSLFSKASLPLFAAVLIGLLYATRTLLQRGYGARAAFGMYLVAFLVYPAISKVSQNNYCVWTATCLLSFWLIGYCRKEFVRATFIGLLTMLVIGYIQDRHFVDFTLPLVPWYMILVSSLRQIITVGLAVFCLKEIYRCKLDEPNFVLGEA